MTSMDKEKLDWASDLLKDWQAPDAHKAAYEWLSHEVLYSPDADVRREAQALLDWAAVNNVAL